MFCVGRLRMGDGRAGAGIARVRTWCKLGGGAPRASERERGERADRPLRSGFLIGHRERACARAVVDQGLAGARSIQHAGAPGRLAGRVRGARRNALARLRHHSAKLAPPS